MRLAAICAVMWLASIHAFASNSFTVVNNSFESPGVATGADTNGSATGWSSFSAVNAWGVFNPVIGANVDSVPDGSQILYVNPDPSGGGVFQDLTANGNGNTAVEADTTYQFTIDIGARKEIGLPASFDIRIAFDLNFVNSNTCAPGAGAFVTCIVAFDSALAPADIGQDLTIAVFAQDASNTQVLFDNAAFTSQADTPEPASVLLTLAGLAGFALRRCTRSLHQR